MNSQARMASWRPRRAHGRPCKSIGTFLSPLRCRGPAASTARMAWRVSRTPLAAPAEPGACGGSHPAVRMDHFLPVHPSSPQATRNARPRLRNPGLTSCSLVFESE